MEARRFVRYHGRPVCAPTPLDIRVEQPFSLYAIADVEYNGRAKSSLKAGRLLIIHKSDGTLLIHGDSLCTPRNYQPPGAILKLDGNRLVSTRKGETIIITICEILSYTELPAWSTERVAISRTERELRDYLASTLPKYIDANIVETHIEFKLPVGAIDILAIDSNNSYHIIEVKRRTIGLPVIYQLNRYVDYLKSLSKTTFGYVAGPGISKNALHHLGFTGYQYLAIEHQVDDVEELPVVRETPLPEEEFEGRQ